MDEDLKWLFSELLCNTDNPTLKRALIAEPDLVDLLAPLVERFGEDCLIEHVERILEEEEKS